MRYLSVQQYPEIGLELDFTQLPKHILNDEARMGFFTSAATNRAKLSIEKHNAECIVREGEKIMETRRDQLHSAALSLANADKVLKELWDAAWHPSNALGDARSPSTANTRCDDAESTASEASE